MIEEDDKELLSLRYEHSKLRDQLKNVSFLLDNAVPSLEKKYLWDIYPKSW